MQVLVLCHGNINRSPVFAAILRKHTKHKVRSRGFGPSGQRVPRRMRELVQEYGYDVTKHRSQQVKAEDFLWADCIIYMDSGQRSRLQELSVKCMTICAGTFIGRATIPDPHFLTGIEFKRALDLCIIAARNAVNKLAQVMNSTG